MIILQILFTVNAAYHAKNATYPPENASYRKTIDNKDKKEYNKNEVL